MSSPSALLSAVRPRVHRVPRAPETDGDLAAKFSSDYGLTPDGWQEDILDGWLGRRRDGRYAAATCGLAVPRQNGKNGVIEMRELFGMVGLGERFLHTAHEVKTARKAFLRIASFFENPRDYPELAALVKDIRKTNGQEAVLLTNGGGVEFIARSSGSGRGFTVDVLVCDEAQDLTDDELAALLPTISAAPLGNPQVILTGTPPDPEKAHLSKGEVFRRVRQDGEKAADRRLCWTDFGVPDGPLPDVDDRELWAKVNPALASRLNVREVERERGLMSPETFARERLGWWGDPKADSSSAFTHGSWPECALPDIEPPAPQSIGVAISIDQAFGSIAAAGRWDDGRCHLGVVDRRRGTRWLVDRVAEIQTKHGVRVVVDPKGPTAFLVDDLERANVVVTVVSTQELLDGCGQLYDDVRDGRITHAAASELDQAVAGAVHREIGDSGRWAWGRKKSSTDVSMLEAATLAYIGTRLTYDVLDSVF